LLTWPRNAAQIEKRKGWNLVNFYEKRLLQKRASVDTNHILLKSMSFGHIFAILLSLRALLGGHGHGFAYITVCIFVADNYGPYLLSKDLKSMNNIQISIFFTAKFKQELSCFGAHHADFSQSDVVSSET